MEINGIEQAALSGSIVKDLTNQPVIGNNLIFATQGQSIGAIGGSTDIHAGSANQFYIQVDGDTTPRFAGVSVTGLTTAAAIALAVQANIQSISTGNYSGVPNSYSGVTVSYTNGEYVVTSGTTGTASSIVITSASSNDLATVLKLGVTNGGVETVGYENDISTSINQKSILLVNSNVDGVLSAQIDGIQGTLSPSVQAGVWTPLTIPLLVGSAYNLLFSVNATLQLKWGGGF